VKPSQVPGWSPPTRSSPPTCSAARTPPSSRGGRRRWRCTRRCRASARGVRDETRVASARSSGGASSSAWCPGTSPRRA